MNKSDSFKYFIAQMKKTIDEAKGLEGIETLVKKFTHAVSRFEALALEIGHSAWFEKELNAYAFAHPFLEVTGEVTFAWMHLWRASVAAPKFIRKTGSLEREAVAAKAAKNKDATFYTIQIQSAKFFINTLLPSTYGKMEAIFEGDSCVEDILEVSFGSK
jgi:hypothetical protein